MINFSYPQPRQLSQADASMMIDYFVEHIELSSEPAFIITTSRSGEERAVATSVGQFLVDLQPMYDFAISTDGHAVSEKLRVFREACQDVGIEFSPLVGITCLDESESRYLSEVETFNWLVDRIRERACGKRYLRERYDCRYRTEKNQVAVFNYAKAVLEKRSRTVIVRIDFSYLGGALVDVQVKQLFEDLRRFMLQRRGSSIFKHEVGHTYLVGQDADKGYLIRTTFFFDGTYVKSDWNKARSIGEFWSGVTQGRGGYFSSNHDMSRYWGELGVGVFDHPDERAIVNIAHAIRRLSGFAKPLRIKPVGARCFHLGAVR
ncbi:MULTISPECIES: hypothetical protein [unclassified Pseudomonas]|uniref:hypothetical protein n=1 Tax=unclassified Pseudomonas TaxID=196821 RepID=UPI000731870F|nr:MULTISPECIES: hypothetical protein [unclassified Pseudomonas]OBP07750.1 hypothetical protein BAE52_26715 [Pseudomonas sp. EGD-AKN5]QOF86760.1 hypothetical protein IG194_08805 [Pseudomonas sp. ADPe]